MQNVEILGVKVSKITYQEALEETAKLLKSSGKKHYIVTPNPEMIVAAQNDSEFKEILNSADLSIADGAGLVKLARLTGKHLPERISGVDFVEGLAGMAEEFGFSMFFLGGGGLIAKFAAEKLKKLFPKLKIVGSYSGNADPKFDKETVSEIKNRTLHNSKQFVYQYSRVLRPLRGLGKIDILVVAYGAPKQEKWIKRNLPKLNARLAIGVGGALDYISGSKRRSPKFIQKANLEWLYRLIVEPWRLKRQLALPYFAALILKDSFSQKKNPS